MPIELFFPSIGLGLIPHTTACRMIREAGFTGVEALTTSRTRHKAWQMVQTAEKLGLKLHWHQPWSRTDNTQHWYNHVLGFLRILEPAGYSLDSVLPDPLNQPVVVYADRYREARHRSNVWLQTCTVMNQHGEHKLSYGAFIDLVRELAPPVVFDTQHFLEWYFGVYGVAKLPTNRSELLAALLEGWRLIGSCVREIHFNDCDPELGNTLGRNLRPGEGILPIDEFAAAVTQSGWSGVVVPEVSPFHLYPFAQHNLEMTRLATYSMFR